MLFLLNQIREKKFKDNFMVCTRLVDFTFSLSNELCNSFNSQFLFDDANSALTKELPTNAAVGSLKWQQALMKEYCFFLHSIRQGQKKTIVFQADNENFYKM
jgi:hypothetical protein